MGSNANNLAQAMVQRAYSLVEQIYYAYGYTQDSRIPKGSGPVSNPWRPPQWAAKSEPIFSILPVYSNVVGPQQTYVFDGPMEIDHEQQSVLTLNPIQTGSPVADHAYLTPARVTARLMMSDSMQSYNVGQFADGGSRSVSAWQLLKSFQASRTFLSISTRLSQYDNMLITSMSAVEDKDTRFAGKFTVTFTQILTASIAVTDSTLTFDVNDTSDPQAVVETPAGQNNPQPIPAAIANQNEVFETSGVPGAGSYSSTPFSIPRQ